MGCLFALLLCSCIVGIYAPITFITGTCRNSQGKVMDSGKTWYNKGECARYGCFVKNDIDQRVQYRETCPDYPIPTCIYKLKRDPNGPFPECCNVPVCCNAAVCAIGK